MVINTETAVAEKLVTAEEMLQHPEWGRCELIDGRVVLMSPAGAQHGDVAMIIAGKIFNFARPKKLGRVFAAETGFIISRNPDTVRGPDVMFLSHARIPAGGIPKEYLPVVPDLAVEVVSPNDSSNAVNEKRIEWLEAGAQLVWVIHPDHQTVHAYRADGGVDHFKRTDMLHARPVLPDFQIPVAELFRLPS